MSIRSLCRFLLSSSDPKARVTFPAGLSKKATRRVHSIVREMAPRGELEHHSVNSSQGRVLTIIRQRVHQSTRERKRLEDEDEDRCLRVINAAQPLFPMKWLPAVISMLDLLCAEMGPATLPRWQLNFVAMEDTAVEVLSLLCAYHNQSLLSREQRSAYTSSYHSTALSIVAELKQGLQANVLKTEATDEQKASLVVSADTAAILSIERRLIPRLLSMLLAVAECERTRLNLALSSSLLPAFLPLVPWLQSWVEDYKCGLPQLSATSWAYPSTTSFLFDPPRSSFSRPGASWCGCSLCDSLRSFLQSSEESNLDVQAKRDQRRHIRDRIEALHNPHLRHETQSSGNDLPCTMRVIKTQPLAQLVQQRSDRLQQVGDQLQQISSQLQQVPSHIPPAALTAEDRKRRHEVVVVDVDEEEVQE